MTDFNTPTSVAMKDNFCEYFFMFLLPYKFLLNTLGGVECFCRQCHPFIRLVNLEWSSRKCGAASYVLFHRVGSRKWNHI